MSSPQSSPDDRAVHLQPYLLVPNLHIPDPAVDEIELGSHPWMVATIIEDDDLMFGGKPLSAWYEEDRRRLSSCSLDEEETRGRQRERVRLESQQPPHRHHQRHQQQHHHQHTQRLQHQQHHAKETPDSSQ